MDIKENKENKPKKEVAKSYSCASNFKYKGKEYKKGVDKIKLLDKQLKAAKKNNMI